MSEVSSQSYLRTQETRVHTQKAVSVPLSKMKVLVAVVVLAAVAASTEGAPGLLSFAKEAFQGARDMVRAYGDMREANWKNSDKYFHARGNHDAAKRGPGGAWAAEVISNAREGVDQLKGGSSAASAADQEANKWGRGGGDPDRFRPRGLPREY